MVTGIAGLLFITTGSLIFEAYHNTAGASGTLIGSGVFACLNGLVYFADCALTFFRYD
jgi:hypothetical protein